MVRAKFRVTQIGAPYGEVRTVVLTPQYAPKEIPEDVAFNKATPNGRIEMTIDNPPAAMQFTLGKDFYVDFNEVPEATKEEVPSA